MNIPPMDLGLSSIIYRKEETYEFPKIRKSGKPFKGRHKVKEKEVMQLSVSGFLVMFGASVFVASAISLKSHEQSLSQGVFLLVDYFLNAFVKVAAAFGEAVTDIVPDLPDIPSPSTIIDRGKAFFGF